jgi:hypothetical protein
MTATHLKTNHRDQADDADAGSIYSAASGCIPILGRARAAMHEGRISAMACMCIIEIMEGRSGRNQTQIGAAMGGLKARYIRQLVAELKAEGLLDARQPGRKQVNVYVEKRHSGAAQPAAEHVEKRHSGAAQPAPGRRLLRPSLSEKDRFEANEVAAHREEEPKPPTVDAKLEVRVDEVIALFEAAGIDPDCHRPTLRKVVAEHGDEYLQHAQHWLAGLKTPAGQKAVTDPGFGAYCGKTLGPKLIRLGRDLLERQRKAAEPYDPWIWRIRDWAYHYDWEDGWGPEPGEPGCKAQFDVEAVTAELERIFRQYALHAITSRTPGFEDRQEAHIATLVGAEHARRLVDIIRERKAAADPWPGRMERWVRNRTWETHNWGPRPGEPGCEAPPELLIGVPMPPRRPEAPPAPPHIAAEPATRQPADPAETEARLREMLQAYADRAAAASAQAEAA